MSAEAVACQRSLPGTDWYEVTEERRDSQVRNAIQAHAAVNGIEEGCDVLPASPDEEVDTSSEVSGLPPDTSAL